MLSLALSILRTYHVPDSHFWWVFLAGFSGMFLQNCFYVTD